MTLRALFGNPRVWGEHAFTKRRGNAAGDLIKINEISEKDG
jgi:hypothetical protein